jgi:fructose-1-phosphate kinase PfkB-like protein
LRVVAQKDRVTPASRRLITYNGYLILTLTINPAVDRTFQVDHLVFEDRAYIMSQSEAAGGRGLNASRVIHSFGGKTFAILTAGGESGSKIQELLKNDGFRSEVVKYPEPQPHNLTISDKQGLTVKLNEPGLRSKLPNSNRFEEGAGGAHRKGSVAYDLRQPAPGAPAHFYNDLIQMARERGVNTLLDTDGDALLHGLEANPTVVTPEPPGGGTAAEPRAGDSRAIHRSGATN